MHLSIGILVIIASLKWANWKEWQKYYPTILFLIASNLLYKFFALSKFHLWKLSSQDFFFQSHIEIFLWHIFIINSVFTLIFLSNFPEENWKAKLIYILKWTAFFIAIEIVLLKFNHIYHYNGWHLGWTLFFDVTMFLIIRLHFTKPLLAMLLSIPNILFYLFVFGYI